ncbi:CHAT domain-containing protein [Streptomyces sp. NPDC091280]|uniref:CHAT domain-containing protein n=1 Tax=Streptomyces sp. NPDC091280 TaxID=3365984 RepID=UPI0038185B4C
MTMRLSPGFLRLLRGDVLRQIHRLRNHTTDLLLLAVPVAAALWWESGRADTALAAAYFYEPDEGLSRFLVSVRATAWVPVLIALIVVLGLRRHRLAVFRREGGRQSDYLWEVALRGWLFTLSAAIMLLSQFGGALTRYLPLVTGLLLVQTLSWLVHRPLWQSRTPSRSGHRPPLALLLHRTSRRLLLDLHRAVSDDEALSAAVTAFEEFDARDNQMTAAYCVARYIETCTVRSRWGQVEKAMLSVRARWSEDEDPLPMLAARVWFAEQIGDEVQAAQLGARLRKATEEAASIPLRLRLLGCSADDRTAGVRRFLLASWCRADDTLLQISLDEARALAGLPPGRLAGAYDPVLAPRPTDAFTLARRVQRCANDILQDGRDLMDNDARARTALLSGEAAELAAAVLAGAGHEQDAIRVNLEAYRAYGRIAHRAGTGRSLASSAVCVLRTVWPNPGPDADVGQRRFDPIAEVKSQAVDDALDLSRVGIYLMEEVTGELREPAHWSAAMRAAERLHAALLDEIAVAPRRSKGAETALWLLEARKRASLTGALVAALGDAGTRTPQAQARFAALRAAESSVRLGSARDPALLSPDQRTALEKSAGRRASVWAVVRAHRGRYPAGSITDVSGLLDRLGHETALVYRATRLPEGWQFDIVTLARHTGARHIRTVITSPQPLVLTLDRLERQPDWETVTYLAQFYNKPMYRPDWRTLSRALLPPELIETLARSRRTYDGPALKTASTHQGGGEPPVLLIVPDGPLSGIPWAGLPLGDGTALIEHADLALAPGIGQLRPADGDSRSPRRSCRVLLHYSPQEHTGSAKWATLHGRDHMTAVATHRAEDLITELTKQDWDIAQVVGHGYRLPTGATPDLDAQHGPGPEHTPAWFADPYSRGTLRLADGTAFSDASALRYVWPETVALANCWLGLLHTRDGHSAVGFPVACMLGGARSVLGAVGPISSGPGLHLFGVALRDHASGTPLLRSLGEHMRASLADERRHLAAVRLPSQLYKTRSEASRWATTTLWTTRSPSAVPPADDLNEYWLSANLTPAYRRTIRDRFLSPWHRLRQVPVIAGTFRDRLSPDTAVNTAYVATITGIMALVVFLMVSLNTMRDSGVTAQPPGAIGVALTVTGTLDGRTVPAISWVAPRSPAAAVGLRPGDAVFSVGGTRAYSPRRFCDLLRRGHPGARKDVVINRSFSLSQYSPRLAARSRFETSYRSAPSGGKAFC